MYALFLYFGWFSCRTLDFGDLDLGLSLLDFVLSPFNCAIFDNFGRSVLQMIDQGLCGKGDLVINFNFYRGRVLTKKHLHHNFPRLEDEGLIMGSTFCEELSQNIVVFTSG